MNNETFEMNTTTILTLPGMSDLAQVWYFYPLRWIQSIGAILGNSLVIAAILRFEHLRTPTGSLMANLAVADLLSACLMPLTATLEYMAHTTIWLYICILKSSLYVIMAYGNVLGLAMISIDRLICLTKPFWYRKYVTLNLVLCCQGVMWVATIVACVMVYVFRSIGTVEIPSCFFVYLLSKRDINFLLVYTYYFLTVVVICNYVALAGLVWKQSRIIVDCTASVNAIIQSRHRKLTKVTGLVLVCYLSFTLPAAITTSLVSRCSSLREYTSIYTCTHIHTNT